MRKSRYILTAALITLSAFAAVVYSSCTKDRCKDVACQNGGTCAGGYCTCPTGYSGDFCQTPNLTGIVFKNNTFTPVNIVVNSVTRTVAAGKSLAYYGNYKDSLIASASTRGGYGRIVTWPVIRRAFPIRDTIEYNLDIPKRMFYVSVVNNAAEPLRNVYVNRGITGQESLDILTIPVGASYGIGYYNLLHNSNVRLEADTSLRFWQHNSLGLDTGKVNQHYQAIAG